MFSDKESNCLIDYPLSGEGVLEYLRALNKNTRPSVITMRFYLKTKDYAVSKEEFELFVDEELGMLETRPVPKNLDRYYESQDYISHTDSSKSLIDKMYQLVKKYSLRKKVGLIEKYTEGEKSLLDIGAGTGDFLLNAKERNWHITGMEPNTSARKKAKDKGVDLVSIWEELPKVKYNTITLWHVLEHLPDLKGDVEKMVSLLETNGTLFIAVPNYRSFDATYYKEFWAAYDVPRHLWHFSKEAIGKLFVEHDMEICAVRPMKFDAFYVSLLSEKYKNGRPNYLKAFCVGLWSNINAWRSHQYSSHIYVLKRAKK